MEQSSACLSLRGTDTTWSAARQPRQVPRARATKPADKADRIDNIVVKICGIEEQYARSSCRSRISPPWSIIALCDCWPCPSKGRRASAARQSRTASCYTPLVLPRLSAISAPCTSADRVQKRRGRVRGVGWPCRLPDRVWLRRRGFPRRPVDTRARIDLGYGRIVRLVPRDGRTEQRHLRVRRVVRILRVGQRPARPRSRIAQRRFDLCYVIQQ